MQESKEAESFWLSILSAGRINPTSNKHPSSWLKETLTTSTSSTCVSQIKDVLCECCLVTGLIHYRPLVLPHCCLQCGGCSIQRSCLPLTVRDLQLIPSLSSSVAMCSQLWPVWSSQYACWSWSYLESAVSGKTSVICCMLSYLCMCQKMGVSSKCVSSMFDFWFQNGERRISGSSEVGLSCMWNPKLWKLCE